MRFYVSTPGFHLRPKNTDWISERNLPHLTEFDPRVDIYLQHSFRNSLAFNVRYAAAILRNHTGLPIPISLQLESKFDLRDLRRSHADVIYGHSPTNVRHLPLIWHGGPIFEDELRRNGATDATIEREKALKRRTIERSQLITMHSATGAETLRAVAGAKWDRFRVLPFFLPHLRAVERAVVKQKFVSLNDAGSRIRMLFVGRESKRKGLPQLSQAFEILDARMPGRLELEIVTTFSDGPMTVPSLPNIVVHGETSREEVQQKMQQVHLLLMPSRFETFGWVYLEAMAAGAIAVAADLPTQREILADGAAGLLAPQTGEGIAEVLEPVLRNPDRMLELALAGRARVLTEYEPHAVARRFHELGLEAQELFQVDRRASAN